MSNYKKLVWEGWKQAKGSTPHKRSLIDDVLLYPDFGNISPEHHHIFHPLRPLFLVWGIFYCLKVALQPVCLEGLNNIEFLC